MAAVTRLRSAELEELGARGLLAGRIRIDAEVSPAEFSRFATRADVDAYCGELEECCGLDPAHSGFYLRQHSWRVGRLGGLRAP